MAFYFFKKLTPLVKWKDKFKAVILVMEKLIQVEM